MKLTPETRYTLIGKLRNSQDEQAWEEFAGLYQPVVFRIAVAKGLQHADATDVTQEVLAKVANAIEKFSPRSGSSFRAWLYQITRNLVIDFLRQRAKRPVLYDDQVLQAIVDHKPAERFALQFQQEFQKQIFWIVAQQVKGQVQPATWTAFWESEIQRKSIDEVAELTGMTAGAIYVARSRVIARMRQEVQKRMAETTEG